MSRLSACRNAAVRCWTLISRLTFCCSAYLRCCQRSVTSRTKAIARSRPAILSGWQLISRQRSCSDAESPISSIVEPMPRIARIIASCTAARPKSGTIGTRERLATSPARIPRSASMPGFHRRHLNSSSAMRMPWLLRLMTRSENSCSWRSRRSALVFSCMPRRRLKERTVSPTSTARMVTKLSKTRFACIFVVDAIWSRS